MKQNKINKEMPYYLYIHNIYLYQYHDTKPNPINIDWLLGLTPTVYTFIILNLFRTKLFFVVVIVVAVLSNWKCSMVYIINVDANPFVGYVWCW